MSCTDLLWYDCPVIGSEFSHVTLHHLTSSMEEPLLSNYNNMFLCITSLVWEEGLSAYTMVRSNRPIRFLNSG